MTVTWKNLDLNKKLEIICEKVKYEGEMNELPQHCVIEEGKIWYIPNPSKLKVHLHVP
jgi:hypothetical protein